MNAYKSKALQQPCEEKVEEYWKEHQMTPASIKYDIESLHEWLTRNPHLPNIDGSYTFFFFFHSVISQIYLGSAFILVPGL